MPITRRQLLKSGATLVPAALLMPGLFKRNIVDFAGLAAAPAGERTLIIIQQAGGNDGLNTLVPYSDSRYYSLRPNIGIPESSLIKLDDQVGFNPALDKLKTLWDAGKVAVVEGVGYPNPNFSHFQSMDIWRFADPRTKMGTTIRKGWLGKYLEISGEKQNSSLHGIAINRILPLELSTPQALVTLVENVSLYQFQSDSRYPSSAAGRMDGLYLLYSINDQAPYRSLLNEGFTAAYNGSSAIVKADRYYRASVAYPNHPLATGLRILAGAIASGLPLKVGHVVIGGWDTHANQRQVQDKLLQILSDSIYAFYQDLKAQGKDDKVAVMTWSEFGRRAKSNASNGTDHGTAGLTFILGTGVKGGFYGKRPDLGNLENNNLKYTTDFRSVYATVLENWLGTPSLPILGSQFETIPLFV